jgi:YVTN family beta-propeller protein
MTLNLKNRVVQKPTLSRTNKNRFDPCDILYLSRDMSEFNIQRILTGPARSAKMMGVKQCCSRQIGQAYTEGKMKRFLLIALSLFVTSIAILPVLASSKDTPSSQGYELPNGWRITPAGRQIPTPGDQPVTMIVSPDRRYLIVNTAGFHDHDVLVFDMRDEKIVQSINLGKDWSGMALDRKTSDLYISGGGAISEETIARREKAGEGEKLDPVIRQLVHQPILHFKYANGSIGSPSALPITGLDENKRFISGVSVDGAGAVYALNINTDTLYKLDEAQQTVLASTRVGYRPFSVAVSPDAKELAVSNWGDASVSILDAQTLQEKSRVTVGSHPNNLLYAKDGRLFVSNGGSNSVSVIADGKVIETIKTSVEPNDLVGSTPDALAISPDQKTLYVANADNDDVAVIDIFDRTESSLQGFIPTGWYPTSLAVSPDGKKLFVGVGKGLSFGPNFPAQNSITPSKAPNPETPFEYIGLKLNGAISIVDVPNAKKLEQYTLQVRQNMPHPQQSFDKAYAAKIQSEVFPKIKHVLYIIRENRTYDQVLGDMKQGNGDPHLTFFGQQITPNAHALASQYVLFDNLYVNGEVSEDGHQWCNAAYATDYTERAWTNSYSGRGEPNGDDRLTASPAGYLWDNAARHGLTYRSYGEFARFKSGPDGPPVFTGLGSLKDHASVEWSLAKGRDPDRVQVFLHELKEAEQTGEWPRFMVMSLPEDHTHGLSPDAFTPAAEVASNDQALGQIVEGVSHSRFWAETAIFVIEDDAQNGPDHVDAHRTVGLVISPYLKRNFVDSTKYTTASMVRTMELILGLPPMTQFDNLATPMYNAFATDPVFTAYNDLGSQVDLLAKNPSGGTLAQRSARLDFSEPDRADPDELNAILWAAFRPGEPMPAPVRSAALLNAR